MEPRQKGVEGHFLLGEEKISAQLLRVLEDCALEKGIPYQHTEIEPSDLLQARGVAAYDVFIEILESIGQLDRTDVYDHPAVEGLKGELRTFDAAIVAFETSYYRMIENILENKHEQYYTAALAAQKIAEAMEEGEVCLEQPHYQVAAGELLEQVGHWMGALGQTPSQHESFPLATLLQAQQQGQNPSSSPIQVQLAGKLVAQWQLLCEYLLPYRQTWMDLPNEVEKNRPLVAHLEAFEQAWNDYSFFRRDYGAEKLLHNMSQALPLALDKGLFDAEALAAADPEVMYTWPYLALLTEVQSEGLRLNLREPYDPELKELNTLCSQLDRLKEIYTKLSSAEKEELLYCAQIEEKQQSKANSPQFHQLQQELRRLTHTLHSGNYLPRLLNKMLRLAPQMPLS
eukprot:GILK01019957.1.p1 GENE.GILK01019957.1~~GILK01019957.1.p1  ORF type:complete len:453 (+),score=43.29 GILK01019957.1:160-1359(+)